jgi:hypothetical protein
MSVPVPLLPAGAKPRGDDFNKLRAQLEAQRITGAAGLLSSGFSGGSTLAALGLPPVVRRTGNPRTFFVSGDGTANLTVTAGAINSIVYAGGTLTAPANGDKIYIDATISGTTVTAVTVSKAASVPADTTTHIYTLLATVAVASSVATVTPVAWNYSQLQICAGQGLWGGFGA